MKCLQDRLILKFILMVSCGVGGLLMDNSDHRAILIVPQSFLKNLCDCFLQSVFI